MLSQLPSRNRGNYLDKFQSVKVSTNLFKVNFKQDAKVFIYSFKTLPDIPKQNIKKVRALLIQSRNIVERLIGPYAISGRTVFAAKAQQMGKGAEVNFKVEFEGNTYQAIFKLVRQVALGDVYSEDRHKSGVVYSFLNNMVKNFFYHLDYTEIGRSRKYFDAKNYKNLESAQVTVFKGYSSNFSLLETGLYLQVDSAVKIVRGDTVLQVINNIYRMKGGSSKDEKRLAVEQELVGKMVMANYGKNRYYVIESVMFESTIENHSFNHNGKQMNLIQYYREIYEIDIINKRQPLLKAVPPRKERENDTGIVLVPELLLMSGLPDDFDERKRREVSDFTIVPPSQKMKEIEAIFDQFSQANDSFNPKVMADKLGIQIDFKPSKINAKQLDLPVLQLGGKERIEQNRAANFQLYNKPLFNSKTPLKIAVICPPDLDLSSARAVFSSTSANLALRCEMQHHDMRFNDARQALRMIQKLVEQECQKETNMFWFIIPFGFKSSYSSLKKIMLKAGIEKNSQVTVTSTLNKKGVQTVLTKILLQMAAKVGNKLWVPKVPQKVSSSGVMMVGIESYADQFNKGSTVLSFCCNTSKDCSSFYSNFMLRPKDDQSRTFMREVLFQCLSQYIACNRAPPSDVILIKNGSSKFDNPLLVQTEVAEIRQVFKSACKGADKIKLVYVLLDKQVSQKFFSERGREVNNPSSGLLVNSEVVQGFEFYLIAQHCNRGTVRPTFYRVLHSDTFLEEGVIEELLFSQCFNYMNWSGSIKVPSVMQYAKKLGMFAGQYLGSQCVGEGLHNNLYYI